MEVASIEGPISVDRVSVSMTQNGNEQHPTLCHQLSERGLLMMSPTAKETSLQARRRRQKRKLHKAHAK